MGILTVGLVACAAQKLPHPAPARDLYVSALFKKASAYAEATCDRWYILSAKHGLVHSAAVLEPYDAVLGTGRHTNDRWAAGVRGQLAAELPAGPATLVVLAGERYRAAVAGVPWEVQVPMRGLGIGRQLGWLTAALNGGRPGS